jgi:hypothetical protein
MKLPFEIAKGSDYLKELYEDKTVEGLESLRERSGIAELQSRNL